MKCPQCGFSFTTVKEVRKRSISSNLREFLIITSFTVAFFLIAVVIISSTVIMLEWLTSNSSLLEVISNGIKWLGSRKII